MGFLSFLSTDMVAGMVRAGLASVGGSIIASGLMTAADWQTVSGALVVIAVTMWSVASKRK
jgi:hypothetical protein